MTTCPKCRRVQYYDYWSEREIGQFFEKNDVKSKAKIQ